MKEILKNEQEEKNEISRLEDFSFADVDIFNHEPDDGGRNDLIAAKSVDYNGSLLEFKFSYLNSSILEDFKLKIFTDSREALELKFSLNLGKKPIEITSSIVKPSSFQHKDSLKGLGTKLYLKMLDYFQHLSDERNTAFLHVVKKAPKFFGKKSMGRDTAVEKSEEEKNILWNEIFRGMLLERGYSKSATSSGENWLKRYEPYSLFSKKASMELIEKRKNEELEFEKRRQERLEHLRKMAVDGKLFIHE